MIYINWIHLLNIHNPGAQRVWLCVLGRTRSVVFRIALESLCNILPLLLRDSRTLRDKLGSLSRRAVTSTRQAVWRMG